MSYSLHYIFGKFHQQLRNIHLDILQDIEIHISKFHYDNLNMSFHHLRNRLNIHCYINHKYLCQRFRNSLMGRWRNKLLSLRRYRLGKNYSLLLRSLKHHSIHLDCIHKLSLGIYRHFLKNIFLRGYILSHLYTIHIRLHKLK